MKRIVERFLIILTIMGGLQAAAFSQSDAIQRFFDNYVNDDRFTTVNVTSKMFELIYQIEIEELDEDTRDVIRNLDGLRVLSTKFNTGDFYNEATSKVTSSEYEVLMEVTGNEKAKFWVREDADLIKELLMIARADDEFIMISFTGDIDLAKISRIADKIDIHGIRHLEKMDKEKHE